MQNKQSTPSSYPNIRMRRNRKSGWVRNLVEENTLTSNDLILPLFVIDGVNKKEPIASMPDVYRYSIDLLLKEIEIAANLNINAIALFPVIDPDLKTDDGKEAYNPHNLTCKAIVEIKKNFPDMGVICDVALDPYTSHGHDGLLGEDGNILNDETIEILIKQSLVQANAGADIIAPSDMMDGRVGVLRWSLDNYSFQDVNILSYAAKYASAYYGPFRDAVNSGSMLKGDKKTYQMNPANSLEAIREVELDIAEGADMVMIKPGLPYLDIIRNVRDRFEIPVFAYNVSGEYAMLKAAANNGWLDYDAAMMETLLSFKRAGSDAILTYSAIDAAKIINGK